jgi:hypothetical protein
VPRDRGGGPRLGPGVLGPMRCFRSEARIWWDGGYTPGRRTAGFAEALLVAAESGQ